MRRLGSIGLTFVLVLILMGPLLLAGGNDSWHRDWHYFEHQAHVASLSLAEGGAPDWNPWHCGGYDQAENPQSLTASPLFVLVQIFGAGLGLRLACLIFLCVGAGSMCWFLRGEGVRKEGAIFGGVLWGVLPFMAVHLSEGHVPFAGFCLMPLALGLLKLASDKGRSLTMLLIGGGVGFVLALQLTFGGVYPLAYTGLLLGLYALWRAYTSRSADGFAALLVALGFGALFVLPKLLPAMELMERLPRVPLWTDGLSPALFVEGLVSRSVDTGPVQGHPYHWPEYVFYPGILLLMLVAWGHWKGRFLSLKAQPILLFVLVGLFLMIGDLQFGPHRLWSALPVVGDLQVPSRFALVLLFGLVIWAALAADLLMQQQRLSKTWLMLILVLVVAENWSLSAQWLRAAPTGQPVAQGVVPAPKRVGPLESADVRMDRSPALGRVVSNCYEPGPKVVPPPLQGKNEFPFVRPELSVVMEHPGRFRVQSSEPFVLGQVYRSNWVAEGGRVEPSQDGLTRVIPSGAEVTLTYENPTRKSMVWGPWLAGGLWLALFFWRRRRISAV